MSAFCAKCRGTKVVSVKHGQTFATDSNEEMALAYHDEPCPACAAPGRKPDTLVDAVLWLLKRRLNESSTLNEAREAGELIYSIRNHVAMSEPAPVASGDVQAELRALKPLLERVKKRLVLGYYERGDREVRELLAAVEKLAGGEK